MDINPTVPPEINPVTGVVNPAAAEDTALKQIANIGTPPHIEALTNPVASPMSPVYDAYQQINEGYADFLKTPASKFLNVMKGYNFDPKTQALLTRDSNDNGAGAITSGILKGWLNAISPDMGMINDGSGKAGSVQAAYEGEKKAALEAKQAEEKSQNDIVSKVTKDPIVSLSAQQLHNYDSLNEQLSNIMESGAVDKEGKKVFTPIQAEAIAKTFMQVVRPGARVMQDDGTIDGSAYDALNGLGEPGKAAAAMLNAWQAGTDISLEGDDILGLKSAADVIAKSAVQSINKKVDYYKKNDSASNAHYYDTLKMPEVMPTDMAKEGAKHAAAASAISMQKNAEENVEKKTTKAGKAPDDITNAIKSGKYPKAGTLSPDGKATADGKGNWIEKPSKGK